MAYKATMESQPSRPCKTCQVVTPISEFPFFNGKKWQGYKVHCYACQAAAMMARRASKSKEERVAIRRKSYLSCQDTELAAARERVASGAHREYSRKWREKNPNYHIDMYEKRKAEDPVRYRVYAATRRALASGADGLHTSDDLSVIRDRQGDKCAACSTDLNGGGEADHRTPLFLGGSNWPDNMQWLCQFCNRSKGHLPEEVFLGRMTNNG